MPLTVRTALVTIGRGGNKRSVLRDLFGYFVVPKPLSVRDQLTRLSGRFYDINIIRVSPEDFPDWSWHQICYSLQFVRDVYAKVAIGVGRIEWYEIPRDRAGTKAVIDSESEAEDLTSDWTVENDGLDLFVVRTINGMDGWSAVDGACDKEGKGMTGSVVEMYQNKDDYAGNGFAHEMGHYLGLDHVHDRGNFIGGDGDSDRWTGIFTWQGDIMKRHCFMKGVE